MFDTLIRLRMWYEGRKVKLDASEHAALKEEIFAFTRKYPIEDMSRARKSFAAVRLHSVAPMQIARIAGACALVLIFCGVLSVEAENAKPGHLLYPIKIYLNEKVVKALTISTEEKAHWDVERARRRLEEAEELAIVNNLNEETARMLAARVNEYASKATYDAIKLETEGNTNVAVDIYSDLEATFQAHERVLARLQAYAQIKGKNTGIAIVHQEVSGQMRVVQKSRTDVEDEIAAHIHEKTRAEADEKRRTAEENILQTQMVVDAAKNESLEPRAGATANARLKIAQDALVEGELQLKKGSYDDAFVLFHKAQRIAQEVSLMVQASRELKLSLEGDATSTTSTSTSGFFEAPHSTDIPKEESILNHSPKQAEEILDDLTNTPSPDVLRQKIKTH